MPYTRGLSNEDRSGTHLATVTADASLVLGPCIVYDVMVASLDATTSAHATIANSSASGSGADKETDKLEVKIPFNDSSGGGDATVHLPLRKPWFCDKTCVADITNASVTVSYKDIS